MAHYVRHFMNVSAPEDFRTFWSNTVPYRQDGCCSVTVLNRNYEKVTKASLNKQKPKIENCEALKYVNKWSCVAWDCGVIGWVVTRKVNKIVNHHVKEITERKTYKTKPKHILKGGRLESLHQYVISYDGRCYDRLEHGGFPPEYDEFSE